MPDKQSLTLYYGGFLPNVTSASAIANAIIRGVVAVSILIMDIIAYQTDLLKSRFKRVEPKWVEHGDCIEIIAANGISCFVDLCDRDLADYSWYCQSNSYFTRNVSRSHSVFPNVTIYLAPLILERMLGRLVVKGEHCDHIDWNKLNNRRSNLRLATKAENAYNIRPHARKDPRVSNLKGVSQAVDTFRVQIQYSTSIAESGFRSAESAARRYDDLAAEHHGKFAVFNYPNEWVYDLVESRYVRIGSASLEKGVA